MSQPPGTLRELAWLFLRLGTTAFGGPAVHIAMMEDEVVRRRGWMTRQQFLDYVGAVNLIPGPNSTELAIHVGHLRAGWPGLLVAGTCFIAPASVIVLACAWVYVRYGTRPELAGVLYGIKPVVIAVVGQALWGLGRTAVKSRWLGLLAVASIVAAFAGVHELAVLGGAAILGAATVGGRLRWSGSTIAVAVTSVVGGLSAPLIAAATANSPVAFGLTHLFLVFARIGSVLFGSGYVLLAFLRAELVERLGWLTEAQLLDATAIGQVTPGPVFTTATFIGYVLGGVSGAATATVGIFVPAFVFVAISGPLVPRLRRSALAGAALDGVNVASLALMALVTWQLGRAAIVDVPTTAFAALSVVLLVRYRLNSACLVLAGAAAGLLAQRWF